MRVKNTSKLSMNLSSSSSLGVSEEEDEKEEEDETAPVRGSRSQCGLDSTGRLSMHVPQIQGDHR